MLVAGGIHGALTPDHFGDWWGYGLFFLGAALAQVVLGLALLTGAINERDFGARWKRATKATYAAGILGNVAIIAMYVVSRTSGIPFFGPQAGTIEEVGAVDVVSKVAEVAAVLLFVGLFREARRER